MLAEAVAANAAQRAHEALMLAETVATREALEAYAKAVEALTETVPSKFPR